MFCCLRDQSSPFYDNNLDPGTADRVAVLVRKSLGRPTSGPSLAIKIRAISNNIKFKIANDQKNVNFGWLLNYFVQTDPNDDTIKYLSL